jgi:hypothetical protein
LCKVKPKDKGAIRITLLVQGRAKARPSAKKQVILCVVNFRDFVKKKFQKRIFCHKLPFLFFFSEKIAKNKKRNSKNMQKFVTIAYNMK